MAVPHRATTARGNNPTHAGELGSALRSIRFGIPDLINLLGYEKPDDYDDSLISIG